MADVSRVTGPLGPFAAGFVGELSRQGFKPETVGRHVALVAGLSGWLAAEGVAASGLSSEVAQRYAATRGWPQQPRDGQGARPAAGVPARAGHRAAGEHADSRRPVEELLSSFRRHLEQERGLVPAAARGYVDKVRPFVARFDGPDGLALWRVDVVEVRAFVVETCPRLGRRAAQMTVVALRSLLRFLHLEGVLERSLAGAVPSVFGSPLSGLPKRLEPGQVDALLESCDTSTVIGIRDLAILTVLARLALRAAEVAALSLEDMDWRAGELVVRGKGGRSERMPLPADVGAAIVGYLRDGRPAGALDRSVFVRVYAPHRRLSPGGVTFVVAAAARRAGLGQIHAHRLRHAAASELLRAGVTLPEVGQVLRHRHARSTRDLREGRPRGAPADRASVAGSGPMSGLRESLAEYLAVRRALGYRLERTEKLLGQFLDYLDAAGADRITVEHAVAWATRPAAGGHWHAMRLGAVRGFARYLHEVDPRVEVPAADLVPDRPRRAVPYLYTDEEIQALIEAAGTLRSAHKTATFRTLFGLLIATGMRIGEAIALDRADFDADPGTLIIRHGKFGKSRELPLHASATSALTRYLARRDRPRPAGPTEALLVSNAGTRLFISDVETWFRALRARAGILPRSAACRPRLHDMRHSFAVRTLLDAYRADGDPAPRIAALSIYLGHVDPGKTYWYLQAAPELMALAGERLERHLGGEQ